MAIHDWTRVDAGLFHHFHQTWITALCHALNTGALPPGYFALAEQVASGPIPDVLTLQQSPGNGPRSLPPLCARHRSNPLRLARRGLLPPRRDSTASRLETVALRELLCAGAG